MTTGTRWIRAAAGEPIVSRPAYVRVRCCGSMTGEIEQGGIIGRGRTSAFRIKDKRLSEAHAMLAIRQEQLVLLGLRQKLIAACGARHRELPIRVGSVVTLAEGIDITVEEVHVPETVARVVVNERPPVMLLGSSYSLVMDDDDQLTCRSGYDAAAAGFLMWRACGWVAMVGSGDLHRLHPGDRLIFGENVMRVEEVPLLFETSEFRTTIADEGEFPLRMVVRYDTVHLHRADRPSLVISGTGARIISELAQFDVPVSWEMVARQIWTDDRDRALLRKNWDRHMGLVRKKLRDGGFPDTLVRPDGCGNVEIFLREADQVVDQT